jgi:hypothetical protein
LQENCRFGQTDLRDSRSLTFADQIFRARLSFRAGDVAFRKALGFRELCLALPARSVCKRLADNSSSCSPCRPGSELPNRFPRPMTTGSNPPMGNNYGLIS